MADPILRVVHLSKRYAASYQNSETVVLSDVCLEAYPGESIAIVGPSGSGKSTLLQIIGTLDRPSGGEVWLGDRNVSSLDDRELTRSATAGPASSSRRIISSPNAPCWRMCSSPPWPAQLLCPGKLSRAHSGCSIAWGLPRGQITGLLNFRAANVSGQRLCAR